MPTYNRLTLTDLSAFTDPALLKKELVVTIRELKKTETRMKIKELTTQISQAEIKNAARLPELHRELRTLTAVLTRLS